MAIIVILSPSALSFESFAFDATSALVLEDAALASLIMSSNCASRDHIMSTSCSPTVDFAVEGIEDDEGRDSRTD